MSDHSLDCRVSETKTEISPETQFETAIMEISSIEASETTRQLDNSKWAVKVSGRSSTHVETAITITDDNTNDESGVRLRAQLIHSYTLVYELLFIEVSKRCTLPKEVPQALPHQEGAHAAPQYEPSKVEKCSDCICQAYTCSNLRRLKKRKLPSVSKEEGFASENLRKARALGIKVITDVVTLYPYTKSCIGSVFRDVSVYGFFLFALIMFIVSLVSYIMDRTTDTNEEDDTYHLANFILSIINLVFSCVDMGHHTFTHEFTSCRDCTLCMAEVSKTCSSQDQPDSTLTSSNLSTDSTCSKQTFPLCKCKKNCSTLFDGIRLFLLELLNYPNLLSAVFKLMVQIVYKQGNADWSTYVQIILTLLIHLVMVYLARWLVLTGTIFSVQNIRNSGEKITAKSLVSSSSSRFHITFVLNAIGHTIVQILLVVIISGRFYHEIQDASTTNYLPSPQLWYMIVFGYVGPAVGVVMFLVTCHFWTQKFPIELYLDILKLLKKPGFGEAIKFSKVNEEHLATMNKVHEYLDKDALQEDFDIIDSKGFIHKFSYPFKSPLHIIVCLVYCGLLLAFVLCAIINGSSDVGWIVFYVFTLVLAVLVNVYACAIAMLWASIILLILILIALIILLIALFVLGCILNCISSICGTNDSADSDDCC